MRQLIPEGAMERAVRLREDVVLHAFVSEAVLVDVRTGECYALDPECGRMVQALVDAPSPGAAAEELSAQGFGAPEEVLADLLGLRGVLAELGVLAGRWEGAA